MNSYILIILPGWLGTSKDWKFFVEKINPFVQTSVLDLPGFGNEPPVSENWGIPDYAKWVETKIEQLYPYKRIIILGHSFGGRIACEIASKNFNWLHSLILFSAPVLYRPSSKTKFLQTISPYIPKFIKSKFSNFSSLDYRKVKNTKLNKTFKNTISYDQTEQINKISTNTTILWGLDDNVVPYRIVKETNDLIPNSKLITLSGVGHYITPSNSILLYGIIKNCIKEDLKND